MIGTENIGFKILFFQMGPKIFVWCGGPGPAAQEPAPDEEIPSSSGQGLIPDQCCRMAEISVAELEKEPMKNASNGQKRSRIVC